MGKKGVLNPYLFVFLSLFVWDFNAWAQPLVAQKNPLYGISVSVVVERPLSEVFDFVSNAENDVLWRSEVHSVSSTLGPRKGSLYYEDAQLGIHQHYYTYTQIIAFKKDEYALYETPDFQKHYLTSLRRTRALSPFQTEVTYEVQFSRSFVRDILGFPWPGEFAKEGYRLFMCNYMQNLKIYLESQPSFF